MYNALKTIFGSRKDKEISKEIKEEKRKKALWKTIDKLSTEKFKEIFFPEDERSKWTENQITDIKRDLKEWIEKQREDLPKTPGINVLFKKKENLLCLLVPNMVKLIKDDNLKIIFKSTVLADFLGSKEFLCFLEETEFKYVFEVLQFMVDNAKKSWKEKQEEYFKSGKTKNYIDEVFNFEKNKTLQRLLLIVFNYKTKKVDEALKALSKRATKATERLFKQYEEVTRKFFSSISQWDMKLSAEIKEEPLIIDSLKNFIASDEIKFLIEECPFVLECFFNQKLFYDVKTIRHDKSITTIRDNLNATFLLKCNAKEVIQLAKDKG